MYTCDLILYILSVNEIHLAWTKCDPNDLVDPDSMHLQPSSKMELVFIEENIVIFMCTHYNKPLEC